MARKAQGPAQGDPPMPARAARRQAGLMARYLLHHRHEPDECGVAFASFQGHHPADGEPNPQIAVGTLGPVAPGMRQPAGLLVAVKRAAMPGSAARKPIRARESRADSRSVGPPERIGED